MRLHDSMRRKKVEFEPLDERNVRMYVCGPTVYDRAHIGNARPVVVFDVLFRLLRHLYGAEHVTYVRNVTDVDDKINARAAKSGRPIRDITEETLGWYREDMAAIGALPPTHEPRATEHIAQMVRMIERLIGAGNAYEAEGHVLFAVRTDPDYGVLSKRSVDDMIAGARVEVAPYKRDPMDFVLWKPSGEGTPGWDSPWGRGRPGWHIECSAMSAELLGPEFDIHGGGADLKFPHHENEIAQSTCAHPGAGFARYWMHSEMLRVEGQKMSKSLGNFFTVRDLLDTVDLSGAAIRLVLLSTHYRKVLDWTDTRVTEARRTIADWAMRLHLAGYSRGMVSLLRDRGLWQPDTTVLELLADDMNVAGALAQLHRLSGQGTAIAMAPFAASLDILGLVDDWDQLGLLAGLGVTSIGEHPARGRVAAILLRRQDAKREKDYRTADAIRKTLEEAGVVVTDEPGGTSSFVLSPAFDESLLDRVP